MEAAKAGAEVAAMAGGKRNKWMTHVRKTKKAGRKSRKTSRKH